MPEIGVRRSPDVAWVDSGGRVVVLRVSAHDPVPLVLEGSAGETWRVLEQVSTVAELVLGVASRYGVDPSVVASDIEAFVRDSTEWGIVEVRPVR
jgi:hypothetical protein